MPKAAPPAKTPPKRPGRPQKGNGQAWEKWLGDPDFRRWHEELASGSGITAIEYSRVLTRYCNAHKTTPRGLVELATRDVVAMENQIMDFIRAIEKVPRKDGRKTSGSYVRNFVKVVKSWLLFNRVQLVRRFKVHRADATPTLEGERVPTQDELKSILSGASDRARAIISLMAFTGVRPQVLGYAGGRDGLRIRDLPELEVHPIRDKTGKVVGGKIRFTKTPALVVVRDAISKTKRRYYTFLAAEGCDYVKAYLENRMAAHEELEPDSPVIGKKYHDQRSRDQPFITAINIGDEVRGVMWRVLRARPYVLRAYFDTQLLQAERAKGLPKTYRVFWMGHVGDTDSKYTTNKPIPADLLEDMRTAYRGAESLVATAGTPLSSQAEEIKLGVLRELAKTVGIDPMRIRVEMTKDKHALEPEHEIKMLAQEMAKRFRPETMKPGSEYVNGGGRTNKVVKGDKQLVKFLNDGWELVQSLAGDKFLIRQPTRA